MTAFTPRNPDYQSRTRDSFSRQGLMQLYRAEMTLLEPGMCEIRVPWRPELGQQHDYFHGGVLGAIGDTAAGYASFSLMAASDSILTVEYKMNLLAPGKGDALVALAEVVKPGRTLTVARTDIFAEQAGAHSLCATMLVTLMTLKDTADKPKAD